MQRNLLLSLSFFLYTFHVASTLADSNSPSITKYFLDSGLAFGSGLAFNGSANSKLPFIYAVRDGDSSNSNSGETYPIIGELQFSAIKIELRSFVQVTGTDAQFLDIEGVAIDLSGDLWLADETGPSLVNIDSKSGKIKKRLSPDSGLPSILSHIKRNNGFEGVATNDSGHVYGLIESTLDIEGKTANKATFVRLVEYDEKSGDTKMYAIPFDLNRYEKRSSVKFSDLCWLDGKRFLVIEHGKLNSGVDSSQIYLIDISGATDISNLKWKDKELEKVKNSEDIFRSDFVTPITKSLVFDLTKNGWSGKKAEGLAISPDRKTVIVSGDKEKERFSTTELRALVGKEVGALLPSEKMQTPVWFIHFNSRIN